jgi:Na+/H+ antiporter 1
MSVADQRHVERIVRPFQDFAHKQSSGGIVLIVVTVVALVWANSPWGASYAALWGSKLTVGLGDFSLSKDLTHWINDGLMAIFFLVVGLEIKREVLVGELSSVRGAALPVAAAVGGAVVPAALYVALNAGTEGSAGWGIPMATDIAFALGVLALLGRRAPVALKVFLTAVAMAGGKEWHLGVTRRRQLASRLRGELVGGDRLHNEPLHLRPGLPGQWCSGGRGQARHPGRLANRGGGGLDDTQRS